MPSLWAISGASLVAAVGLTLLLAAMVGEPPRADARCRRRGVVGMPVGAAAALAVGVLASLGLTLAALTAAGVAMAAAAGVVALIRARPGDDGGDGGSGGDDDEPAPDPPGGGDAIDWERFEAAFREYAERQPVA